MSRPTGSPRLSIGAVVTIILASILAATALLVYLTFDAVGRSKGTHEELVAAANRTILLEDIRAEYVNEWRAFATTPTIGAGEITRVREARERVDWSFAQLLASAESLDADEIEHIEELSREHTALADGWLATLSLRIQGRDAEAALVSSDLAGRSDPFIADITREVQAHRIALNDALVGSHTSLTSWQRTAVVIGGAWIVVLVIAGFAANRWILEPLGDLSRATRLIAAGQLSEFISARGPKEISQLAGDVNLMALSLVNRSEELNQYLAKNLEARTAALEGANLALSASESRLQTVLENAPVILFALDAEGNYTLSKGKGLERFGIQPGGLNGRPIFDVFSNDDYIKSAVSRALKGEAFAVDLKIAGFVFETHFAPLPEEGDLGPGVIGVAIDVTDRQQATAALRQSEERYRELFQNATDIVYTHDLQGRFTSINHAGQRIVGYSEAETLGKTIAELMTPETFAAARELLSRKLTQRDSRATYEIEILTKDGRTVPLEVSTRLVFDGNTPVAVQGIARDVSIRREAQDALQRYADDLEALNEQLAAAHVELADSQAEIQAKSSQLELALAQERVRSRIDPLTGGLNHGAIVEELRQIVSGEAGAGRAAVLMLDIDGMKAANDLYGHQFGDQVLRSVKEAMSRQEAVVGRYGGDEFVALLADAGETEAAAYRAEVLRAIASAGLTDPTTGSPVPIIVSAGYALYPDEATRIEDLIGLADSAMYTHKREQPAAGGAATRRLGGDRAVQMLGQLVPVLTGTGDLAGRLAQVVQRLALDFGYDGVELSVNPWRTRGRDIMVGYPPLPDDLRASWKQRAGQDTQAMVGLLANAAKPVIFENPGEDRRLAQSRRDYIRENDLKSLAVAPLIWEDKLLGGLAVVSRQEGAFGPAESQVLMSIASQIAAIASMATLLQDYRQRSHHLAGANREAARLLAAVAEAHAGVSSHDFERLHDVAVALARHLGCSESEAEQVGLATMLHDVGKYRVPAAILAHPDNLTAAEYEIVKNHTIWGAELMADHPAFELASQVAHWHHERWDGEGYPDGLAGDAIPLAAAIASVADALDAMLYERVYSHGISPDDALDELAAGAGGQFSPAVVGALLELHEMGRLPFHAIVNGAAAAA